LKGNVSGSLKGKWSVSMKNVQLRPFLEWSFEGFAFGNDSFYKTPVAAATIGRSDYENLHLLCRKANWGPELKELTVRCLQRAVKFGVSALYFFISSYRNRSSAQQKKGTVFETAGITLCSIIFVLWTHFLIYCKD